MTTPDLTNFPKRPRIVFMGTPDFAVPALASLLSEGHSVIGVVTQPDRPKGRGRKLASSPVKEAALKAAVPVWQPEKTSDPSFIARIRERIPDLLVVVAFGQILNKALLQVPTGGAINIHASLLPRYRGAAPIQWAILNNETVTGLTAMRMAEGLDAGPVLLQEEVAIGPDETAGQLHDRLAGRAGPFLLRTLQGLARGRLSETPQDVSEATYTKKIDRRMARIDWRLPADRVSALIRGLDPWPGAYTTFKGREIKVFASSVETPAPTAPVPGKISGVREGALRVETGDGLILLRALQVAGKKRLLAVDFLRGFPLTEGDVLGS
jgi:methionyl-tRNA formyltransferase